MKRKRRQTVKKTAATKKKAVRKKTKNKKKLGIIKFLLKFVLITGIILGLASVGIVAGIMYGFATTTRSLNYDDIQVKIETTYIYDDEGNEIASLIGNETQNREQVLYKDIPEHLKKAIISIEDERFEDHFGVDIIGLFRAVWLKIKNPSSRMHGASTITQQVVKNLTGEFDISMDRKIKEWFRAVRLERELEKWQILEIYLNILYMGNSYYGVQSSSKAYFGKDVSELSLAECALLAGITNEPFTYNPFTEKGQKNAKERQETILYKMLELGHIDEREYEQAKKEDLHFAKRGEFNDSSKIQSYFVDQVIEDVINDFMETGMSRDYATTKLFNYGLRIYTTQDSNMQGIMDSVFTDDKYFYKDNKNAIKNNEVPQAAMVVIDHQTGHTKALYGGYGEKKASRIFNRATQSERQPGSSIKPTAVYAPAIDLRLITPGTVIDDIPVYLDSQNKRARYPTNFDHNYGGLTTVRNALKRSVNVVAARVWMDILGPDNSLSYLKKVGIDRENERYLSIAMGGLEKGVSPLEMAASYIPFANKGVYIKPVTYTKVESSDGKVLLENIPEYDTVYDSTTAFLMVDMMKEVTRSGGTAPECVIGNGKEIPTAGKTGTTSDNIDKWFVGYTPYYVAATWYGYDNKNERIEIAYGEERGKAKQIWTAVMNDIHMGLPAKDFTEPPGIVKRKICIYSGKIATSLCANDPRGSAVRNEYFIKGTEPGYGELCDVHVKTKVCTASKDIWGRPLLANETCPPQSVLEKILIKRPIPYTPSFPGEPYPLDWKFEIPEAEYCPNH